MSNRSARLRWSVENNPWPVAPTRENIEGADGCSKDDFGDASTLPAFVLGGAGDGMTGPLVEIDGAREVECPDGADQSLVSGKWFLGSLHKWRWFSVSLKSSSDAETKVQGAGLL